ncbi:MAG: hypothetical protein IKB07_08360 [Lachnospiraceae bacterium]|nr:hypothetical protein [Lachnospiraceae bacterium]
MTRVKIVAHQKYNDIEMRFPTALLAGMMMDELIVSTDGDISFTVTVEEFEKKGGCINERVNGETAENTDGAKSTEELV